MNLRELRIEQNFSIKKIANSIGVTPNAISNYELGKRIPKLVTMQKLADALDVDLDTIVKCFIDKKDQQKNTGTN